MKNPLRVLVSGAGIAGPTFAWFFAKTGAHITIVEKSASLLAHGQNVDLQGSALTVIEKMGLTDEVRKYNTTEKGTQFIDSNGRALAPFPVGHGKSASPTSEFEILRGDLAALLYRATRDQTNIDYLFSTSVDEVMTNEATALKVKLSNGNIADYDVLIAADGQWSNVRKKCFSAESIEIVDLGMYIGYWTAPRLESDNDWWNIFLALRSRLITLRPDPHGTVRAMFSFMPRTNDQKAKWLNASKGGRDAQQDLLRNEFSDAGWESKRLLKVMGDAPDFYFQSVKQIRLSKWSCNRVICLGDAAFAPTPLTGMGTSLAILGGYLLAGELSQLKPGETPATAFERYEKSFRPFVEKIQKIPFFVPGIAHPSSVLGRRLFHATAKAISKLVASPWLANKFDQGKEEDFPLPNYNY